MFTCVSFLFPISGVNNPVTLEINAANIPGFPGEKLIDLEGTNIALGKSAKQIGTYSDNLAQYGARNAVDGNIGTISHTSDPVSGVASWWQVDLGDSFAITSIVIINRQDCCQDRLTDFYIRLVGTDGITIVDEKHITEAVSSDNIGTTYDNWEDNRLAQYIRIVMPYRDSPERYIHMAEVQVFGDYRGLRNAGEYCLTGQFDSNVAEQAMSACDDSMALLLGQDMSLGTFISTVSEVEEKGAAYMPGECLEREVSYYSVAILTHFLTNNVGTCCLDDPITSEYFGQQVSIS